LFPTRYRLLDGECLAALASVALCACTSPRSARDQELNSAVIVDVIRGLPDSAKPGEHAGLGALTPDSGQKIQEAGWVSWWHTAMDNNVPLPLAIRVRFGRHFDIRNPPSDPYPTADTYLVRIKESSSDTLVAVIGPSYQRCTYTFARRQNAWQLLPDRTIDCYIT